VLAACGDDGDRDLPVPATGNDVTIEIHREFPFVAGATVDEAEFVAVQDGAGAFVEATGANGLYTVHIESDKFGIAVGCRDDGFLGVEVVQQTVADGLLYQTSCKGTPPDATLAVTVVNLPPGQRLRLRAVRALQTASEDGTFELSVRTGESELFGTLTDADRNVLKLFRFPSVQVAGTTALRIDVAADGVIPDRGTFSLTPADPAATVRTTVVRPYGSIALTGTTNPIGADRSYLQVPAALQQPDDLYRMTIEGVTGSTSRTVKAPGALAFQLPAPFTARDPELLETPFVHPVWTFDPTPATLRDQSYFLDIANSDFGRFWSVSLSARWVGDAATVRYEFPDVSSLPGFAPLALVATERLDTTTRRLELSGPSNVDGAESTSSSVAGVLGRFCGDGVVIAPEACDPGEAGETAQCNDDCTAAACGDGIVNTAAGETCDPPDGATCSEQCTIL
jgi:hypothetical protein